MRLSLATSLQPVFKADMLSKLNGPFRAASSYSTPLAIEVFRRSREHCFFLGDPEDKEYKGYTVSKECRCYKRLMQKAGEKDLEIDCIPDPEKGFNDVFFVNNKVNNMRIKYFFNNDSPLPVESKSGQ